MTRHFLFGLILLGLVSGCATYSGVGGAVQSALHRGNFAEALKILEAKPPKKADRLLHLLDRGTLLHTLGRYEESNQVFKEAEDLADFLETKSATKETAGTLTNETVIAYHAEKYERLLIYPYKMMNYALLGQWGEAMVEVRRFDTMKGKLLVREEDRPFLSPFTLSLGGLLWELDRKPNDALIDYQKTYELAPEAGNLMGPRLLFLSRQLGLSVESWDKTFPGMKPVPLRQGRESQLIVVVEAGRAPLLGTEVSYVLDQKIAMPTLQPRRGRIDHAKVFLAGRSTPLLTTINLARVETMAEANLPHKRKVAAARKVIKGIVKAGAQAATYEAMRRKDKDKDSSEGLLAAWAVGALFNATERADERIWSTLPENFQLGTAPLPPGEHQLEIRFYDSSGAEVGDPVKRNLTLEAGKPRLLVERKI